MSPDPGRMGCRFGATACIPCDIASFSTPSPDRQPPVRPGQRGRAGALRTDSCPAAVPVPPHVCTRRLSSPRLPLPAPACAHRPRRVGCHRAPRTVPGVAWVPGLARCRCCQAPRSQVSLGSPGAAAEAALRAGCVCALLAGAWSLPDASGRATKRTGRSCARGDTDLRGVGVLPRPQPGPPVPSYSHGYRRPCVVPHPAALHSEPAGSVPHTPAAPLPGCALAPVASLVSSARRRSTRTFRGQNLSLGRTPHAPPLGTADGVGSVRCPLAGSSFAGPRHRLLGRRPPQPRSFSLVTRLRCQHLGAPPCCHCAVPPDVVRPCPSPAASGPLARCALCQQCPAAPRDPGKGRSLLQAHSSPRPCGPESDGLARPCRLGTRPASAVLLLRAARRPPAPSRGSHRGQGMPGVWDRSEESRVTVCAYVGDRAAP